MKNARAHLKGLAVGQFLSVAVTVCGVSSSLLARQGIRTPTLQSAINYFCLAGGFGTYLLLQKHKWQVPWVICLALGVIDVEANYIVVTAYQYTSLTSVMLLDCWSIPVVMLLTAVFLRTRYFRGHYLGVVLCVLGLSIVLLSDVHAGDRAGGSNPLLGDFMVLVGSTMYGVSNVSMEYLVKKYSMSEVLASFPLFAAIITVCQVYILELKEIQSIHWNAKVITPFLAYSFFQLAFSCVYLVLIKTDGSTMFNLALLTSDMYAVAVRALFYHESVDWLYFVACGTVALGLGIYSYSGEPPTETEDPLLANKILYEKLDSSHGQPTPSEVEFEHSRLFNNEELLDNDKEHSMSVELTTMR